MLHWVFATVSAGGDPLGVESTYAQILRLIQGGMFAGVLYLIKLLKETKGKSADVHGQILDEISEVKALAQQNFETNRKAIAQVRRDVRELREGKE